MFLSNPNNLGIIGSFSHSMARRFVEQADCVLVFGAGLNFLTMSFGASLPAVPLIHVDRARGNIGRWTQADVAVVGDAKLVAEQILAAVPARTRARQSEAVRTARDQVVAFIEALEADTPVAVASALLRPAETALEELLGLISTDEIVDRVFREFCIGK